MKLSGKTALITGSGTGIGRAMALLFAREGADIAVNDINLTAAEETADAVKGIGRKAIAVKADVGDEGQVDMMVDRTLQEFGGIQILVNNAGVVHETVPTIDSSIEKWDYVMRVVLRGTYLCCRRVGRWMVSQRTGKVVNMGSVTGLAGHIPRPAYAPARAGVAQLTRCLAMEWARYNINVNSIAPAFVMTEKVKAQIPKGWVDPVARVKHIPLGRPQQPEHIAKAALFLVSDDASEITGVTLPVDGGWLAYRYED